MLKKVTVSGKKSHGGKLFHSNTVLYFGIDLHSRASLLHFITGTFFSTNSYQLKFVFTVHEMIIYLKNDALLFKKCLIIFCSNAKMLVM